MVKLKLSKTDIEKIVWALNCVYAKQISFINSNDCMFTYKYRQRIIQVANTYSALASDIKMGFKEYPKRKA